MKCQPLSLRQHYQGEPEVSERKRKKKTWARGRINVFHYGQVKLCSTGFITHVVQSEQTKSTETEHLFKSYAQPGPVSAKETFRNRTHHSVKILNSKDLTSTLSKVAQLPNKSLCSTDRDYELENKHTAAYKNFAIFQESS